jgi:hypothetical protein
MKRLTIIKTLTGNKYFPEDFKRKQIKYGEVLRIERAWENMVFDYLRIIAIFKGKEETEKWILNNTKWLTEEHYIFRLKDCYLITKKLDNYEIESK